MKKITFAGLLVLLFQQLSLAQSTISVARERVLSKQGEVVAQSIDLFPLELGIGKVRVKTINIQNASAMRLHFRIESAPATPSWAVQVKDSSGRVASIISASMISGRDFWSEEIPGTNATVEVITIMEDDPSRRLELKIVEIAKSIPPITPESITPPNQLEVITNQPAAVKTLGRTVARLRYIGDDGNAYVCTGFLVSRDLFMTNNHCIRTDNEMRSGLADFDFDEAGSNQTGLRFKELVLTNAELDFSILRLVNAVPSDRGFLRLLSAKPAQNQNLLIIQHPGGEPKQVSRQQCIVENPDMAGVSPQLSDFSHLCDTKGGSSGSPVIDNTSQDFRVIGLHHLGFDTGNQLLVNRAVRIGSILELIRRERPSVLAELGIQ